MSDYRAMQGFAGANLRVRPLQPVGRIRVNTEVDPYARGRHFALSSTAFGEAGP